MCRCEPHPQPARCQSCKNGPRTVEDRTDATIFVPSATCERRRFSLANGKSEKRLNEMNSSHLLSRSGQVFDAGCERATRSGVAERPCSETIRWSLPGADAAVGGRTSISESLRPHQLRSSHHGVAVIGGTSRDDSPVLSIPAVRVRVAEREVRSPFHTPIPRSRIEDIFCGATSLVRSCLNGPDVMITGVTARGAESRPGTVRASGMPGRPRTRVRDVAEFGRCDMPGGNHFSDGAVTGSVERLV